MIDEIKKMFVIMYAIQKDLLPFKTYNKNKFLSVTGKLVAILLSIIILGIMLIGLLPFALFRLCVGIVLKILHGELYGGFLNGLDVLFEINSSKTVINVILIYSSKDEWSVVIKTLKRCVYHMHHSSFKFASTIRKAFGYCYYLKKQVNFEDIIEITKYNTDEYMNRTMLYDYLEGNCLTIKNNHMWNVVFFSQPIRWTENSNNPEKKQYAVVWTIRHSLGDGPSIITIFKKHIIEDNAQNTIDEQKMNGKVNLNLDNVCVVRNPITAELDGTPLKLHGNSNWHISSFIESKAEYISKIKKIKDKLNVRFSEVLCAAISVSISNYIAQRNITLNGFTIGTAIRLKNDDLLKLKKGTYTFENVTNNFALLGMTLPLHLLGRSLKSIILYIHNYNESLRYAVDPIIAYEFLRSICTYLPAALTGSWCKLFMDSMTVGITNLVGFQKSTWHDNTIDDAFFFSPGFLNTGFIFNVFSYDGRLQLTLTSREGFVHDREELQNILDAVFKNIDKAEKEILKI